MKKFFVWLSVISSLITILLFVNEFFNFLPFQIISPDEDINPAGNVVLENNSLPPFDFSRVSLAMLRPIRPYFYNGSNNMVYYYFKNPNNLSKNNFTLIGEWFLDNKKEPLADPFKFNVTSEDIFYGSRLNWKNISSDSEDKNFVRFRVALSQGVNSFSEEINYSLIFNESLVPYLESEEEGKIKWNNKVVSEFVANKTPWGKTDLDLAKEILDFTQNEWMNRPAETKEVLFYNSNSTDSISSWNSRVGTSSEYSYVYAMLLRIVGIPSKVEVNPFDEDYYYVEAYIDNEGWIPIDVYGDYGNFGECFKIDSIKKNTKLKNVCIESLLEYVEFEEISIKKDSFFGSSLEGIVENIHRNELEPYCIKVNFTFNKAGKTILELDDEYIFYDILNVSQQSNFKKHLLENTDYDIVKIELNELNEFCK